MESANRVLTRRALDMLKSIAVGEYVPPEERQKVSEVPAPESEMEAEEAETESDTSIESETMDAETEAAASPREKQGDTPPETQVLIEPTNTDETEPVVGDTSVDPDAKNE
jgi:hypothetical protein